MGTLIDRVEHELSLEEVDRLYVLSGTLLELVQSDTSCTHIGRWD